MLKKVNYMPDKSHENKTERDRRLLSFSIFVCNLASTACLGTLWIINYAVISITALVGFFTDFYVGSNF